MYNLGLVILNLCLGIIDRSSRNLVGIQLKYLEYLLNCFLNDMKDGLNIGRWHVGHWWAIKLFPFAYFKKVKMHEAYELILFKLHSNPALSALFHLVFTITQSRCYLYFPHYTGEHKQFSQAHRVSWEARVCLLTTHIFCFYQSNTGHRNTVI